MLSHSRREVYGHRRYAAGEYLPLFQLTAILAAVALLLHYDRLRPVPG